MVDNLRREGDSGLLIFNDLALKNRLTLGGSDDRDIMWRCYGDVASGAVSGPKSSSAHKALNRLRKKKLEVFCNIKDDKDCVSIRNNDVAPASIMSPPLGSVKEKNTTENMCKVKERAGLILPPKKTIKLEPTDLSSTHSRTHYLGAERGVNAVAPYDVPINLCIKSEPCDSEKPSGSGGSGGSGKMSSQHSSEPVAYSRSSASGVVTSEAPTSPVIPNCATDSQADMSYDMSGSSQESAHSASQYVLSGSSQESAHGGAHYILSGSSQDSAHSALNHNLSGSSQDLVHQSLPVWCDEESVAAGNFIENTAQLSRLERRRQQNREAARRLREKRKKCLDRVYEERREFQTKLLNLQHENELLRKKAKSFETGQENNTEIDVLRRENLELREQLKEHHECKLRMEKLQRESGELRAELVHALRENTRLRRAIQDHKERCSDPF